MMQTEIERKYLVQADCREFLGQARSVHRITQAYLSPRGEAISIRVRLSDERAFLTVKGGCSPDGCSRPEFEYPIPVADAEALLTICPLPPIHKSRYLVPTDDGHTWEVDVFEGTLAPLVLAELELKTPDESFTVPAWLGEEVTAQTAYYNISLYYEGLPKQRRR